MIMKLKDISGVGMGVVKSQNSWRFHSHFTVQQENLIAKIHGTFMVFYGVFMVISKSLCTIFMVISFEVSLDVPMKFPLLSNG